MRIADGSKALGDYIIMKVLFLSNTAGQGHHSTAKALMEYLGSRSVKCRALDTYEYVSHTLYKTIANGYLMATSIAPTAYGGVYRALEKKRKNVSMTSVSNIANSIMSIKLSKFLERKFMPDVIVCTHVFSAQMVNVMKAKNRLNIPVIGIVTDYTIHPFWQDCGSIDYVVTASELLTQQAVERGIDKKKILPLGIPISPKFSRTIPKDDARRQLGIETNKFTVLLMSGSMGYGNLAKELIGIDRLDHDFQVIAVCGNNKHAKAKIDGMVTRKKVYSYGFVNNIEIMMDAADCIITKPGGLTSSEALAKNLPIIMVNPIPGQEERNVEFLLNNGLAVKVTGTFPVSEALYQLFLFPEKLENMRRNTKLVGKPYATRDLCEFIMKLAKKDDKA